MPTSQRSKRTKIGKGFGKQLRKLRKAAGLSQMALGEKTGVHHVSIAQYETGVHNPSEKTAEKIMGYFERRRPEPKKAAKSLERRKKEFYKDEVEPAVQKIGASLRFVLPKDAKKHDGAELSKTPARLGAVSLAWVDQQIDSHVHARGWMVIDGPVRVVCLKRADLVALCQIMVEIGGVKVEL